MPRPMSPPCPACPGQGFLLGRLGRLNWFRCRGCGIEFKKPAPPRPAAEGAGHG